MPHSLTPAGAPPDGHLHRLATVSGEKCGLGIPVRKWVIISLFVCSSFSLIPVDACAIHFIKYFSFSEKGVLNIWKEKIHQGRVDYRVIRDKEEDFVRADSKGTASGIYYEPKKYNPKFAPYISWKWKVDQFPKKDLEKKESLKDDFAARVYVIFPANIFIFSRAIEYIWDDVLEEGTITRSPLSGRIKLFVIRKGKKPGWIAEERNVYQDYLKAFGEEPEDFDDQVGAVAFMTDTDDSGSEARAYFDEMKIGYTTPLFQSKP